MMIDCVALMSYMRGIVCERRASGNPTHEDKIKRTSIDVKCCKHYKKHASAIPRNEMPVTHLRPAPSQCRRTKYSGRCETSFRRCTCMKCARKYSHTSS